MKKLLILTMAILFSGCASRKYSMPHYSYRSISSDSAASVGSANPTISSVSEERGRSGGSYKKKLEVSQELPTDTKVAENEKAPDSKPKSVSDRTKLSKRMIIYFGNFQIEVFNPEQAAKRLMTLTNKFKGYLKSRSNNYLVVRIPAKSFFTFIHELNTFGHISSRRISSEDITSKFVDLTMRLNNLIATRDRLKSILDKSKKIKDTLAVERELSRVTGEIERLKGSLRYLGNLVSFATVSVGFVTKVSKSNKSYSKIKIETPIEWIRNFDIVTLLKN